MSRIDLSSLPGESLLHKLLQYFKKVGADLKKGFHIVRPEVLGREPQRGENCKLTALSEALEQAAFKAKKPHLALYKNKKHLMSLRKLAKKQGSVVGEMYSVQSLVATAKEAGFDMDVFSHTNEDDYIEQLKILVDKNLAPMVFYDLDRARCREGFPYIGDGRNEHAAVVVGYYKNCFDETHFIVTFWNKFYDFDGIELALSACHSLVERREEETFKKLSEKDAEVQDLLAIQDDALEGKFSGLLLAVNCDSGNASCRRLRATRSRSRSVTLSSTWNVSSTQLCSSRLHQALR